MSVDAVGKRRSSMRTRVAIMLATAGCCGLLLSSPRASQSAPDAENGLDPPLRGVWSRGDERFLRHWLLLGPLPGTLEEDELASIRGEAAVQPLVGDSVSTKQWRDWPWGGDIRPMSWLGGPDYRGKDAPAEVGYAFRSVTRNREGDALLSLGTDSPIRIWVNGALVYSSRTSSGFAFDRHRIPVRFNQGENRILVKLEHRSGPWQFALRVLEPGAIVRDRDEVVPVLTVKTPGVLNVRAESVHESRGAAVQIRVTAAGGRSIAQATTARDQDAAFYTTAWPDGAYEVHLTTTDASGNAVTVHAPWYKGDVLAAVQRLVMVAQSAPDDTRGATVRMLAEMARFRLGGDLAQAPNDGWPAVHSPLMEFEELEQESRSGPRPLNPADFVRLAYQDDTDGSTQFCSAHLPAHYDAATRWPLVIELHGSIYGNPPYAQTGGVEARHDEAAERHDVIVLEPHGRGETGYIGIGEHDVLRCLEEARRRLSVDEDRVYLTGESMGGAGTWRIASRHPELFAAAAPVYGGWDWRIVDDPANDNSHAMDLFKRFASESQSSFAGAESLLHVPLFVHHGDQDPTVNVEHSRHAVRMLQRWGYDVRYNEVAGLGHEPLNVRDEIIEWLLTHQRVQAPRKVRIRATDLEGAAAYWVRVISWQAPLAVMRVDAEVIEPGRIRLDTENVASIQLSPPPALLNGTQPLRIVWNGTERLARQSGDGTTLLSIDDTGNTPLEKRPGLAGGLSNFVQTPFAVVVGTASTDARMRALCRTKAEGFQRMWLAWQHHNPRMFLDTEVTPEIEQQYSLLLIGGPDANRVTRRMQSRLPLRVESRKVTIDGRAFAVSDGVVQMIFPSPAQPKRYVLVVAATSTAGMYFWNPALVDARSGNLWLEEVDWTVRDGRRVSLERGVSSARSRVASGVFDRHWRRDDRWIVLGDADVRARSPLRHLPSEDLTIPAKILDSYVGDYEFFPGLVLSIARVDTGLTSQFGGVVSP